MDPESGYYPDTLFTIWISDWITLLPEIVYRVWSSESADASVLGEKISNDWVLGNESVSFYPTNTNPIIIEISDSTYESLWIAVEMQLEVKNLTEEETYAMVDEADEDGDVSLAMSLMFALSNFIQSIEDDSTESLESKMAAMNELLAQVNTLTDSTLASDAEKIV